MHHRQLFTRLSQRCGEGRQVIRDRGNVVVVLFLDVGLRQVLKDDERLNVRKVERERRSGQGHILRVLLLIVGAASLPNNPPRLDSFC